MFDIKEIVQTGNGACIYRISVTNWMNPNNAPPLIFRLNSTRKINDFLCGEKIGIPKQFEAPAFGAWEAPS